jgi:hypothetical protein
MNDTSSPRPPRPRTARARPKQDAESVLASIPAQTGQLNDGQAADEEPLPSAAAYPGPGRIRQVASVRKSWILAGGALAAGGSASEGVTWALTGRPGAGPLLATAALLALAGIMSAIAAMYESRQKTLRMAIKYHGKNTIADAVAGTIHATHTMARNLSGADAIDEARRGRAGALKSVTDMPPAVISLLTRPPDDPG